MWQWDITVNTKVLSIPDYTIVSVNRRGYEDNNGQQEYFKDITPLKLSQ